MNINSLTPIEIQGTLYYKRDDFFVINGVCGGKARVVYEMVKNGIDCGNREFVLCGSRDSRQCEIVAKICEFFGVNSHLFMPSGKNTDIIDSISNTNGATIHRTKVGYNNVLISQSKAYALERGWSYIPFGLECQEAIAINMPQVQNIPDCVNRIVVPCGGGMNMIAIIKGLDFYGMHDKEVVGVIVGKNPKDVFAKYIQNDIFNNVNVKYRFEHALVDYHTKSVSQTIGDIELDPIYEAKCVPFLQSGDLMWIVGRKM